MDGTSARRSVGFRLCMAGLLSGCQTALPIQDTPAPEARAPAASPIIDYARTGAPICPADGSRADEQVAASLHISIAALRELQQNRRRSNAELCALNPEKLARELGMLRVPRPIGASDQEFRLSRLRNADGSIDDTAALRALERRLRLGTRPKDALTKAAPDELAWRSIGPGNSGGRIRSIVVDADDNNRVWVGAVTGGIWYSSDGGQQWTCVTDSLGNVGINWLTQDPGNPSILYAVTGEATTVEPVGITGVGVGIGILVSRDRGMTWSTLHTGEAARGARRIVVIPGQPQVLVTTNDLLGIYRSVDGGATWSQVRAVDKTSTASYYAPRFYDLKVDPGNAMHLIAGDRVGGVVRSTDAGATWSARIPVAPSSPQPGRVEVAFAASNAGWVYATVSPEGTGTNQTRLYRSTDAGSTWTFVSNVVAADPQYASYQNGNRSYNNALWVDPTDANHVVAGDVDLFRSTDGGQSWTGATGWAVRTSDSAAAGVHSDHHVVVADPGYNGTSNKRLWLANDGGVYRSDDISRAIDLRANFAPAPVNGPWAFTHLNSRLPITQFYAASGAANLGGFVLGGSQDNGTQKFSPDGGDNAAVGVGGGDGLTSAIDPGGSGMLYATGCCGFITRLVPDIHYQIGYRQDFRWQNYPNEFNAFATFIGLDPNDRNRLLMAGGSLWLSSDPWAAQPSRTQILPVDSDPNNNLRAFAVAPTDSNTIWAMRARNGLLHKTVNGLATQPVWKAIFHPVGNSESTGIYIDPDDANVVYTLYGGTNGRNIWRTTDGGAHWQDITGALPGPVYAITRHPTQANWLFAGAESGLYDSVDGGASWHAVADGPSGVAVESLVWYDSKTLIAATYGRGMYIMGSVQSAVKTVIEFYNAALDHYFITYVADEIAKLDNGTFKGWARTGLSFKAFGAAQSGTSGVCRIYIPPGKGDGHFFGRDNLECIVTIDNNPTFILESATFFYLYPPSLGTCAAGTVPVYRVFSNRADANHRYTADRATRDQMVAKGWLAEGDGPDTVVMCAPA